MSTNVSTPFFVMNNKIQNYPWGSVDSVSKLFNIANPDSQPQAEIWMGAHPNGCSEIEIDGKPTLLSDFIQQHKPEILSPQTAEQFGELPYLFKVLAAAQALSIQVHPSKQEAEIGFEKENQQGIALNAANRNYKDPNHKPELVYALTPYQAMNGFRPLAEIIDNFEQLNIQPLKPLIDALKRAQNESGLEAFFTQLLSLQGEEKTDAVGALLSHVKASIKNETYALIEELSVQYPGDIGLFAPLMLHVLTLQPGEAMYLDARTPHAYLKGTGLEIMANSDNVLRAGLTPKHMDVAELAKCTKFAEKPAETLLLEPVDQGDILLFPVPVPDFKFAIFPQPHSVEVSIDSAEVLMPLDAGLTVENDQGISVTIDKGQSVFVPAYTASYKLSSAGRVARAYN